LVREGGKEGREKEGRSGMLGKEEGKEEGTEG